MLVFSISKEGGIRCESGGKAIVAFPEKQAKADALVTLFPQPEEAPQKGTISWPGEYDVEGIAIRGIGQKEGGQVSYAVEMDGMRCAFLSSPLQQWADFEMELLGNVDVLIVPSDVPKTVQSLVDEIDPSVLIPVPMGTGGSFAEVLKVCGAQGKEPVAEYKLKALPVEGREVVVLRS